MQMKVQNYESADRRSLSSPYNNYVCDIVSQLELFKGTVAGVHLLENIYQAFDEIARRRRVFKVETIGDCYVAVCGCLRRERITPS
jgi:hypothetical protein